MLSRYHRTGNLVRLNSSNSRDGTRAHVFVPEVVLERRRFFDHFGSIPLVSQGSCKSDAFTPSTLRRRPSGSSFVLEFVRLDCSIRDACRAAAQHKDKLDESQSARRLCLENFIETRDKAASRAFRATKKFDRLLESVLLRIYMRLYTMITFTRIFYADAARRTRLQDRMTSA
jgi:hypothetical protein